MYSKVKLLIFFISLLFLSVPKEVLSAEIINITDFPANKIAGEEFEVSFDASGLSVSTGYYMKGLGGDVGSSLTEVDTWNGAWFQQNGAWSSMPAFNSNPEGSASATLKVRFDPNVSTNTKELKVRIRKTEGGANIDSSSVNISITATTPAPTQAPTAQPTSAPTSAPTARPTPTRTSTPKPSFTPVSSDEPEETSEPSETTVLETTSTLVPSPTGLVAGDSTTKKSPILAITFVIAGVGCLGYVGYLLYNSRHAKTSEIS